MASYAHVDDNGLCDNVIVLDPSSDYPMDGLYALDDIDPMPWIGWSFDGKNWAEPTDPALENPDDPIYNS